MESRHHRRALDSTACAGIKGRRSRL